MMNEVVRCCWGNDAQLARVVSAFARNEHSRRTSCSTTRYARSWTRCPPPTARVFDAFYVEEQTLDEIAKSRGVGRSTVQLG